jgi:hypothetical protein
MQIESLNRSVCFKFKNVTKLSGFIKTRNAKKN